MNWIQNTYDNLGTGYFKVKLNEENNKCQLIGSARDGSTRDS